MDARAYERGRAACYRGKTEADNPYHQATSAQTRNWREWQRGFREATGSKEEQAMTARAALAEAKP